MNTVSNFLTLFWILWLAAGVMGAALAGSKGRSFGLFLLLGLFLAPVILILAVGLPDESGPFCPRCHGKVRERPAVCRWCGGDLMASPPVAKVPEAYWQDTK